MGVGRKTSGFRLQSEELSNVETAIYTYIAEKPVSFTTGNIKMVTDRPIKCSFEPEEILPVLLTFHPLS